MALLGLFLAVLTPAAHAAKTSLWVFWTAGGDDGTVGRASSYEMRYSTDPVTGDAAAWWQHAHNVPHLPKPSPSGATDSVQVTGLSPGTQYTFVMRARDKGNNVSPYSAPGQGSTEAGGLPTPSPMTLALGTVTPNPTAGPMSLPFTLPSTMHVDLEIQDVRGRTVMVLADQDFGPGWHSAQWDGRIAGSSAPPAIYFFHMRAAGVDWFRKVAIVR